MAATPGSSTIMSSVPLSSALTMVSRAVKAISFYPAGHPQRDTSLNIAHEALLQATGHSSVSITVSAEGLTSATPLDPSPTIAALARELFSRLIKQVTFLPGIERDDFAVFAELLALDPTEVRRRGGASRFMGETSARTIIVTDIDPPKIGAAAAQPVVPASSPSLPERQGIPQEPPPFREKKNLLDYIVLMASEKRDSHYIFFGDQLVAEAARSRTAELNAVIDAVTFLGRERQNLEISAVKREHAGKCLEAVCDRQLMEALLERVTIRHPAAATYLDVMTALGAPGVKAIIAQLFAAQSMAVRKMLASAVVKAGAVALPYLREALADDRWYVVRNAVSIMAAIGTPEVAYDLEEAANQPHEKVMREAIIGLSKVSAPVAEDILLRLAESGNQAQAVLAVHALGLKRSRDAVPALLRIVTRPDLFLRRFALKREAIVALSAIAAPEGIETLALLIATRRIFVPAKWRELKLWCIRALAAIDDDAVTGHLEDLSRCSGAIGAACREALEDRRML